MKNVKIEDRAHGRLRRLAKADGRLIGPLATELLTEAIEARAAAAAKKPKPAAK